MSAVGAGVLVLAVVAWLWKELASLQGQTAMYAQTIMAVVLIGGSALIAFWIMNKANVVDFLIATDAEMRKVNWPTRKEIIGSTWIVICGTILMALLLWVVDIAFAYLFQAIGVLEGGG